MTADVRGRTFRKSISGSDRWWLAHPATMSPVIQTVIEGTGAFDPERLTSALALAAQACPDTALGRRGRAWRGGGIPPRVRVVEGAVDGRSVANIPALHDALPTGAGGWCEVLWCPGTPAALVFRASHAVMDWPGMALWIADVFRILRGEAPQGAPSPITEMDVFERFAAQREPRARAEQPPKPKIDCVSPLGEPAGAGARRTRWARLVVDGYHPALVAKLATALTRLYGLDSGRFAVAFDLRRHVPQERTTGSLSQVELFEVPAGESWEALHERLLTAMAEGREVSQRMESALLKIPSLALRTLIKAMENGAPEKKRYASVSVLAHLGRIELAHLCAPEFEAHTLYPLPLLTAMSPPDVNLVECGGRTEVTLTWRDGPSVADRAEAVLAGIAELLSPAGVRQWAGNSTRRVMGGGTVVDRFRARVARCPGAVAVRWPGGELTFAELDARSEVVASRLVGLGVGRESVVGLLADRSVWAVVGLWGVLKAGAAYLPLDVRHPDNRLAGLLADAGVGVCLVQGAYAARAVVGGGRTAVVLDELPVGGVEPVGCDPVAGDLAYVIYTSGSTGVPKGVEVEHGALANYVGWATHRFKSGPDSGFAVFTSLAFDLSNTALFVPITAGGTLVLVPDEPNHLSLRQMLEHSGADTLSLTPSHLDLMSQLDLRPTGFRVLVVVGEQLRRSVAARAQEMFGPDCLILNMYGPTEATVGCTVHQFITERDTAPVVSVGLPMGNCTVHLLDPWRRFVPVGEVGEVYLGGAQLARGYRGRPDLTRERFVHLADGSRVYRTGDLAKVRPDGLLEFVGRADDQVKVNGYRVEPAEIAQVLERHPDVRAAVVVARRRLDHTSLYGYVVTRPGAPAADWDGYLAEYLPRYMIPSATVVVDAIPHNANGKIDVAALPDPTTGAEMTVGDTGPDGDDVQLAVARIWAATLNVDGGRLDGRADFHQLGGNSILLLTMLAGVCRDVVGPDREKAFMAELGQIIREPTLERVAGIARRCT